MTLIPEIWIQQGLFRIASMDQNRIHNPGMVFLIKGPGVKMPYVFTWVQFRSTACWSGHMWSSIGRIILRAPFFFRNGNSNRHAQYLAKMKIHCAKREWLYSKPADFPFDVCSDRSGGPHVNKVHSWGFRVNWSSSERSELPRSRPMKWLTSSAPRWLLLPLSNIEDVVPSLGSRMSHLEDKVKTSSVFCQGDNIANVGHKGVTLNESKVSHRPLCRLFMLTSLSTRSFWPDLAHLQWNFTRSTQRLLSAQTLPVKLPKPSFEERSLFFFLFHSWNLRG